MELLFRWHSILQASKSSSCGISFADSKVPDQAIIKTNPKQFPLPTGGGGMVDRHISSADNTPLSRSLAAGRFSLAGSRVRKVLMRTYIYIHMHEVKRNIIFPRTQAQRPPIPGPCIPCLGVSRTGVLVSIWKPPVVPVPESWTRFPQDGFCQSSYRLGTYTAVIIP